jgi:hypothetical protein
MSLFSTSILRFSAYTVGRMKGHGGFLVRENAANKSTMTVYPGGSIENRSVDVGMISFALVISSRQSLCCQAAIMPGQGFSPS